ncbi:MAG: CRISPR-associated helicase Cas3' [Prevotella sp.]|nr:CRISPR-associated helicase Cas3' [Prevotella sp.]
MIRQTVISHLYNENGRWIIQTNDEHQKGVAEMATCFTRQFGLSSWGYALGMFHDKGKERVAFQQYIRKKNGLSVTDQKSYGEHYHAFVGGILAMNLMGRSVLNLLANQVISHHTGLHDYVDVERVLEERQLPTEISIKSGSVDKSLLLKELSESPFSKYKVDKKHFHHLSRMLFSCLVDADRLDTERFMDVVSWSKRGCSSAMTELLPKLEDYLRELQQHTPDNDVNRIRKQVQEQCGMTSSGEKGFYSLTVPTGGGKTLSSLLWAMKHAVIHGMNRIVIAIPYTSIIVQTAGLLKEILGEENVLEHHSNFNPDEIKDEDVRDKAKLATENWDYPIIVTTNVQLFESMFSNMPSDCRKLHNIVNSVLVLDEVQTLPMHSLQPIVDALKAYQTMFGVSVLFTTASLPVLSGLIKGANPKADFDGIERITEIIPKEFALHDKLRRVELDIDNTGKTYDEIAADVAVYDKVLCIVNTRKDAKELYDRLPNEGVKLHLSRMMCPSHISETILRIKSLLKDESQPVVRVIATQLVEAGVDIDFPVVFRQEAGLDSVLQAAGRCNREGRHSVGTTYVFSLSAEKRVPFGTMAAANNARLNLPADSDWFAPSVMEKYFHQLYSRKNTFDDKDMKHYLYNPNELCFETASKEFRMVDDDCMNVIVNMGNSMELVEKLKKSGYTYPLMKQLAQFTVGIHRSDFDKFVSYGAIEEVLEGTYVLTDREQYDSATGLCLDNHWMEEILMI